MYGEGSCISVMHGEGAACQCDQHGFRRLGDSRGVRIEVGRSITM